MIGERLCYAFSFAAEAFIVWLYLDYLFGTKMSPVIRVVSFTVGYIFLYIISLFNNTTVNAIFVCIINFFRIVLVCSASVILTSQAI